MTEHQTSALLSDAELESYRVAAKQAQREDDHLENRVIVAVSSELQRCRAAIREALGWLREQGEDASLYEDQRDAYNYARLVIERKFRACLPPDERGG